jgi:phosphate transport system protein
MDEMEKRWHEVAKEVLHHCELAVENLVEPAIEDIECMMGRDQGILRETTAVQKGCLALIALQQPMAVDLRRISSYLRSADDVERINRSCIHIAEVAKARLYEKDIPEFQKILALSRMVAEQLSEGIEAFQGRDVEKAREVIESDKEIDSLYSEIFGGLMDRVKADDARASLLMFVARWLERIGDRAVRLASRAIYIVEGVDVELEAEVGEYKVFPNHQG